MDSSHGSLSGSVSGIRDRCDQERECSDGKSGANEVEVPPDSAQALGIGRDNAFGASPEPAVIGSAKTMELTRITASSPMPAPASILAAPLVRQADAAAAAAQMTRRIGSAGSAFRSERRKSTAYAESASRRQIQTRSHASQALVKTRPVRMRPGDAGSGTSQAAEPRRTTRKPAAASRTKTRAAPLAVTAKPRVENKETTTRAG
jgi:hypothetical protein